MGENIEKPKMKKNKKTIIVDNNVNNRIRKSQIINKMHNVLHCAICMTQLL